MILRRKGPQRGRRRWLILGVALGLQCTSDPDFINPEPLPLPVSEPTTLFVDVTETHLPRLALEGFSMDARPADLDGDGDLDLLVAVEFEANILLLNDGEGRFTAANDRLPRANHDSEDVAAADFDGDGDVDLLVVSEDDRVNEFYVNDGQARFPVTGTSNAVVAADLDGDGATDVLIGNNGQNVFLRNDGVGFFIDETASRLPTRLDVTQDLELGDVDGDGDLDLLVGNEDANRLLINTGAGVFEDETTTRLPVREAPEETREADFGDVDGDGDPDILFANVDAFVPGADPQNRLLLNDGAGFFSDETAMRLPPRPERSFDGDFVDVDGDGDCDIVTANSVRGSGTPALYSVYLNDGTGHFSDGTTDVFPAGVVGNGFDVEAADFNGDGRIDLYLASRGGPDRLLFSRERKE